VEDVPIAVPITAASNELNDLVNKLIQESQIAEPKTVEFEFLIDDELLRTSLKEFVEVKELSTEKVLLVSANKVPCTFHIYVDCRLLRSNL